MSSKHFLRNQRKEIFKTLNQKNLKEEEKGIVTTILNSENFKKSQNIGIYIALNDEVYLNEIIEKSWQAGKSIYVPRIEGENMEFYEIKNWQDTEI